MTEPNATYTITALTWTNITVKLSQLIPWADNPKTSTGKDAAQLTNSFEELGQFQTIAIGPNGEVYDGHQRLSALKAKHGGGYEVEARQASRTLTEQERRKIAIYSRQIGAWDWDILSGWEASELIDWGLDNDLLNTWGKDYGNLAEMLGAGEADKDGGNDEDIYSRKVETPTYTPKGDKPAVKDLYDTSRTDELLREIEAAGIPDDEKQFLIEAARRHTIFTFDKIAEYYSHSDKETQLLMENSALVIIDFNKAIELGYVKLTEELKAQFLVEYPDE